MALVSVVSSRTRSLGLASVAAKTPLAFGLLLCARYRKWLPGMICGQLCAASPLAVSNLVSASGIPPESGICQRALASVANKMRPSFVQAPPLPLGARQSVVGVRAARSMRRNLPSEKNAMDLLSGDQNGEYAPSVPIRGRSAPLSKVRNHNPLLPRKLAT